MPSLFERAARVAARCRSAVALALAAIALAACSAGAATQRDPKTLVVI